MAQWAKQMHQHQRTTAEIEAFVREVWANAPNAKHLVAEASGTGGDIELIVCTIRTRPPLTYRKLARLADFIGSRNIEVQPLRRKGQPCRGESRKESTLLGWKLLIGA